MPFSLEFQFIHLLYQYRFVVPILFSSYNLLLSLFILMVRQFSVWLVDTLSAWLPYLICSHNSLNTSLLSVATQMFQAHFVFSCTQCWDESILQGALVTFSEEWYLNLGVGVLSATRIAFRPSQPTMLGNICIILSSSIKNIPSVSMS